MKAYKISISGSFHGGDGEVHNFNNLEGLVPYNRAEIVEMHLRRYAAMWIMKAFAGKVVFRRVREMFIDQMDFVDSAPTFSFIGKDIKQMSDEELQDLATYKDLRAIPFYRKDSAHMARTKAYCAYSSECLGKELDYRKKIKVYEERLRQDIEIDFSLAQMPELIVEDDGAKSDSGKKGMDAEKEFAKTSKRQLTQ